MTIFNMKVKGKMELMVLNLDKFKTVIKKQAEVQNRQAIREWLKEAVKHIPTYTGTARGTLIPVGKIVGRAVKKIGPLGTPAKYPERAAKKKYITGSIGTFAAGFKEGGSYSQVTAGVELKGMVELVCSFHFTNDLPYVAINDASGGPPDFILPSNPPWHSHEKAAAAWTKYVLTVAGKCMAKNVAKAISISRLRIR
jgi:hypothetical protein